MPEASKIRVFASDSPPWAGNSWPFQTKVTPAALPMRTSIWRVARKEACAGAMRVSSLTGLPSAVTEIQEVSVARIVSVRGAGDGAGAEFGDAVGSALLCAMLEGAGARGVAAGCAVTLFAEG